MDERALLEAWAEGDENSGQEFFQRHFDALYRFFRTKVPNSCEDLIQTTMLQCLRSKKQLSSSSSPRAFIFGVARNCLLRHFRDHYRDRLDFDAAHSSVADLDPRPSTLVARNAEHQRLLEGMRSLPVDLQIVLELHYWEEMSTRELADALSIPQGTVKSRLRRARETLRDRLEQDPPDLAKELPALSRVIDEI